MAKITNYLEIILNGGDLSFEQAKDLLDVVFEGGVDPMQVAAFLSAMRIKRASVGEISGLATSLRNHSVKVQTGIENLVDTCGTGGAKLKTFNISTAAAIVAASCGVHIAKHGNRGITSKSGSADVLLELGVNIEAEPETIAKCIKECKIGFMFAPRFHPAMKHVQPIRRSLDFRTAFNILGPLANPACATKQLIGVAQKDLMERVTLSLKTLGIERAFAVHSDGLDEISTMGVTDVLELRDGRINTWQIVPEYYGIKKASYEELKGGDAKINADIIRAILSRDETGAKKDIVVLNAAAAILLAGVVDKLGEAVELADAAVKQGKARQCLDDFVRISNSEVRVDV